MYIRNKVLQAGLLLPVSPAFTAILACYIPDTAPEPSAITVNFRDPEYSAEEGGFHPVEVRLTRGAEGWYFDYLTDFSFRGHPWPELEKELDISWSHQYVWHSLCGDLDTEEGGALFELWQRNFIRYWRMRIYQATVTTER